MSPTSGGVAAVLSFLVTGLGQIYNGQIKKGLWLIFFSALSMLILISGVILIGHWFFSYFPAQISFAIWELNLGIVLSLSGLVLICILGIYSIFDAYKTAEEKSSS
ncbi:MAG: hypothetical protein NC920_06315 [Candidatus Omnitrophica bacterium]|nr:hypothetical protein [Candidatus Omnitrophota bacterium]